MILPKGSLKECVCQGDVWTYTGNIFVQNHFVESEYEWLKNQSFTLLMLAFKEQYKLQKMNIPLNFILELNIVLISLLLNIIGV